MRIWPLIWPEVRLLLVPIAGFFLGGRVGVAYAYSVLGITNSEIIPVDLVIAASVGFLILVNLHPKYRPTRRQAIGLMIYGFIMAIVGALITLQIYAAVVG
jgi:uncharacterized membrane protein YfcA